MCVWGVPTIKLKILTAIIFLHVKIVIQTAWCGFRCQCFEIRTEYSLHLGQGLHHLGFGTHDHNVLIRGGAVGCVYLSFGVSLDTLDGLSPRPNEQRQIAVVKFFVNIS